MILLIVTDAVDQLPGALPTRRAVESGRGIVAHIVHDAVALYGGHGISAVEVGMHTHPDDVVALLSKNAQHRVTQRAIGAIGRGILLNHVFLAGIDCAVEHERRIQREDVVQHLFSSHGAIDGQGMVAAEQVIGHEAPLYSDGVTRLDCFRIEYISHFLAVHLDVKGQRLRVKRLVAPVLHLERERHHFAF